MPLVPVVLQTNLKNIMDPGDPNLHPENVQQAIQNFANAINNYAQFVVPLTTPISQQLGVQAFITTMNPLNAPPTLQSPTFMDLFPTAMLAYATQLGLGMSPAFVGTPPITPLNVDSSWQIGLDGGTTDAVITSLVTTIDLWFRTGLAVNTTSGVTVPWI